MDLVDLVDLGCGGDCFGSKMMSLCRKTMIFYRKNGGSPTRSGIEMPTCVEFSIETVELPLKNDDFL